LVANIIKFEVLMKFLSILLGSAPLFGCASITGSSTQSISVTTVCEGKIVANIPCILGNNKGQWLLTTAGSAQIHKSYEDLTVSCKKDASEGKAVFRSKNNTGTWGNILLGGVVGYAVDSGSGSGFDYPGNVTVVLNPPCPQESTP
jgi:hypothetical protein